MAHNTPTTPASTYRAERATNARLLLTSMGPLAASAVLLALAWWLRSPLHQMPLERDEGAYALIGARWLAGDRLYADLFDHKPPLIYALYALAQALPGGLVGSIRALATLYLLATGLVLLALGWRLYGRWAGVSALAVLLAYASSQRFQGLTFNTEAAMALPATAGCLLLILGMQKERMALFGLAGVCVGLAAAAKPVGAALLAPLCLAPLLLRWPVRWRLAVAGLALVGAAIPALAIALALWAQGSLGAAAEALITYNRLYAAESAGGWDLGALWHMWAPMLVLGLPALAGLVATLRVHAKRTPAHALAALWGLALLATALLSLRAYPHYYLAAVPLLSLWAGALVTWLGQQTWPARWLARVLAWVLLCGLIAPPVREIWPLRSLTPEQQITALYGHEGEQFFWPAAEVAAYLDARLPLDQTVFVWASEPEIYYLARRRPPTRFVYDYPIDRLPGAREAVLAALRKSPPRWILTYHAVRPIGFYPFADDLGYQLHTGIRGYDLFVREGAIK